MKKLAAIAALTLAMGGAALAAPGDNPLRRLQYVLPDGQLMEMEMKDPQKAQLLIKQAKMLGAGTLILTMDGHVYMLEDVKQADGRMLSDTLMH